MSEEPTPDDHRITVAAGDPDLDARLNAELDRHNFAAVGESNLRELTVKVEDGAGDPVAGLSGWTWGTCAGIARSEGLPVVGAADVHFAKLLAV